mgnify:CR=1 FL=1
MKLDFSNSTYIVEELRNKKRQLIARIYTKNGKSILRDIDGTKLGTYDSKENKTMDKQGHLIGYGNWLVALLFDYQNLIK